MDLDAFIGEWTIEAGFEGAPPGTATFEWILGAKPIVQRSEIPGGEALDATRSAPPAIRAPEFLSPPDLPAWLDLRELQRLVQRARTRFICSDLPGGHLAGLGHLRPPNSRPPIRPSATICFARSRRSLL
jgi:hypothetical protein